MSDPPCCGFCEARAAWTHHPTRDSSGRADRTPAIAQLVVVDTTCEAARHLSSVYVGPEIEVVDARHFLSREESPPPLVSVLGDARTAEGVRATLEVAERLGASAHVALVVTEEGLEVPSWTSAVTARGAEAVLRAALLPLESLTVRGLICISSDDVSAVLPRGGRGFGVHVAAEGEGRPEAAASLALTALARRCPRWATLAGNVLMLIRGDETLSLHEINRASSAFAAGCHDDTNLIFAASLTADTRPRLELTVTFTTDEPSWRAMKT